MPATYNTWKYRKTSRAADAIRRRRAAAPAVARYNPRLSLTTYKYGQHKHVCGTEPQVFSLTGIVGTGFAISFKFNDIPNFSGTYAHIYDQIRLDMVEVTIVPSWNTQQANPGANAWESRPQLFGAVDKTICTIPANIGTILQYSNHKMSTGRMFFKLRPEINVVQEDNIGQDTTVQIKNQDGWMSTDVPNNFDALHNGIRLWCDYDWTVGGVPSPAPQFRIFMQYYFSGKCQN